MATASLSGAVRVRRLAQGHLETQLGEAAALLYLVGVFVSVQVLSLFLSVKRPALVLLITTVPMFRFPLVSPEHAFAFSLDVLA